MSEILLICSKCKRINPNKNEYNMKCNLNNLVLNKEKTYKEIRKNNVQFMTESELEMELQSDLNNKQKIYDSVECNGKLLSINKPI
jgi:hypothetical protein